MKKKNILAGFLAVIFMVILAVPVFAVPGKVPGKTHITSIKVVDGKKAVIRWKKVANATSYHIYYKKAGSKKWTLVAVVKAGTSSYTHCSSPVYPLEAGGKYVYTVRGYNSKYKTNGGYTVEGVSVTLPEKNAKGKASKESAKKQAQKVDNYRKKFIEMMNEE